MLFRKTMSALAAFFVLMVSLPNPEPAFAAAYTAQPSQIVCTPYGDLRTQVGLAWVTDQSGTAAKAQVMAKDAGGSWEEANTYTGEAGDIDSWRWHKVTVTGLRPDTAYVYRVGDGITWSDTREFTTAPDAGGGEPFTFLQVNDTQASELNGFLAGQKALEKAAARFSDFRFVVHGGDTVSSGGNEDQWEMYFDTTKNVLGKTVYAGVMGNHENENYNTEITPRYPYRFHYKVPDYATRDSGMYYSFDYGNAHFTVLHGKAFRDAKQIDWLKYDLAKNSKKWNIILIHQPLYSNGSHATEENIISARNVFAPVLIDQFGVDMIFQAHEHTYSRTYPIRGSQPLTDTPVVENQTVAGLTGVSLWDNPAGTVHQLNNACGLKYYDLNEKAETKWFVPVNGKLCYQPYLPTYAGVTVTENEIVNAAYYVDGDREVLIESQGIRKTTPQVNPPRDVKRSYANGSMTLTWEASDPQTDQAVQQYVVYDENNAFTTKNATYFVQAKDAKTVTIPMTEMVYANTNFVVKAIGQHSVSEAGFMEVSSDPENPKTSLWVKSVCDSRNQVYAGLDNGIAAGSYAVVVNNKPTQVSAVCTAALYDSGQKLIGIYQLGSHEIGAGEAARISLPAIDAGGAAQMKILAYVDSADPPRPGGLPLVLNKIYA